MGSADELFRWMAGRRVRDTSCSRCGSTQIAYFRDYLERPVGPCCVGASARQAAAEQAAIDRRIHEHAHGLADRCPSCLEAGL